MSTRTPVEIVDSEGSWRRAERSSGCRAPREGRPGSSAAQGGGKRDAIRSGARNVGRAARIAVGLAALNGFYLPSAALAAQHTGMTLTPVDLAQAPVMRWGWFFIGAYVLAGLISAAACCQMAYSRNLSPAFWFGAGLATNLLAVAAVMSRPRAGKTLPPGLAKIPSTADPALCPGCGARNHPAASVCLNCGAALSPAYEPESRRAGR